MLIDRENATTHIRSTFVEMCPICGARMPWSSILSKPAHGAHQTEEQLEASALALARHLALADRPRFRQCHQCAAEEWRARTAPQPEAQAS